MSLPTTFLPPPLTPPIRPTPIPCRLRMNDSRRNQSRNIRRAATDLAFNRPYPRHASNLEEQTYKYPRGTSQYPHPSYLATFTKGLPHDPDSGLVANPDHVALFIRAINSALPDDIAATPLGPPKGDAFRSAISRAYAVNKVRAWESQAAGSTFDLQGPDSQAVTMPPAPKLNGDELAAEMAELYWMALIRDIPFAHFATSDVVKRAIQGMNAMKWFATPDKRRGRAPFDVGTVFRGLAEGDLIGPYISQFLLVGSAGVGAGNKREDGLIMYGANRIDQRVRVAEGNRDYMTTWLSWLDVQNAADMRGAEVYEGTKKSDFRFISTPRDLATYVHFDALYQAYLNAVLILLAEKAPFDKGLPFLEEDSVDKQQGFATFGAPHILTLVTEVATRALKAVRFQKYNVHRRMRPEAIGGLIEKFHTEKSNPLFADVKPLYDALGDSLLDEVAKHNEKQNCLSDAGIARAEDCKGGYSNITRLLPMAFPEGSPMHPSYGAGHATVAGACVTIVKAFFDTTWELPFAYAASEDGEKLVKVDVGSALTVEGELNKVCANVSIGRNWAGVHYFTDYFESIRMGEQVAIQLLEEQKLTYKESFSMTIPLFDGGLYHI